jgi:ribulose-5-phosphate 4-epimerase/fuculose-1-phosphate aldolase
VGDWTLRDEITQQLRDAAERLTLRGLIGRKGDMLSMRIPGANEILWLQFGDSQVRSSKLTEVDGQMRPHGAIYEKRPDAGAILHSTTFWSEQLALLGRSLPVLFDEQARHLGQVAAPVSTGDMAGLIEAIRGGGNVAIFGTQSVRIGMTRDRIVFNAELFEKCAMAFVIAYSSGKPIRSIPFWVRYIAGRRLGKDQKKASESYAHGKIPEGMNAY